MAPFITGADREELQAQLAEGEQLLWCGKPAPSILSANCVAAFLVGLGVAALSAGALAEALSGGEGGQILLSCFLASVGTLGMLLLPVFLYRDAANWLYGLTDRRAILIQRHKKLYEYPLKPYMVLRARTPQGRCGSIVFELRREGSGKSRTQVEYGFLRTPEAAEALRLLHHLLGGKVTAADKPAELRQQELRERRMAYAKWFIPALVADAAAAALIALLAARLLGLYPAFLSALSSEEALGLLGFIFLMWVCLTLLLRDCYLGRKYMREQRSPR